MNKELERDNARASLSPSIPHVLTVGQACEHKWSHPWQRRGCVNSVGAPPGAHPPNLLHTAVDEKGTNL